MNQEAERTDIEGALGLARRRGFLGRLPAEMADQIISEAVLVRHPTGSTDLPGQGGEAAVVVRGLVRYYMSTSGGRQITIRYVGVGDLVGTVVATGSGLSTGFQAIEPADLLHLDVPRLMACARQRPELAIALVEELTGRLRHAYRALAASSFATVRSRVARDLVERAVAMGNLRPGVRIPVTQQELADATGSVREVVTRSLGELRQLGLVATNHSSVSIRDPSGLEREARIGVGSLPDAV